MAEPRNGGPVIPDHCLECQLPLAMPYNAMTCRRDKPCTTAGINFLTNTTGVLSYPLALGAGYLGSQNFGVDLLQFQAGSS